MTRHIVALAAASALLSGAALAQDQDQDPEAQVTYAQETQVEFGITRVDGEVVGPGGVYVQERNSGVYVSMINLRSDFNAEMDRSVNQVK